MATRILPSKTRHKYAGAAANPCVICGRHVAEGPDTAWVHEHDGGGVAVTEDEAAKLSPGADLGMQAIGPDCLRRHPELAPYVQHMQVAK